MKKLQAGQQLKKKKQKQTKKQKYMP